MPVKGAVFAPPIPTLLHPTPPQARDYKAVKIVGKWVSVSDGHAMIVQDLMHKLGSGNLVSEGGSPDMDADVRSNYLMNTSLIGFEQADFILLIGSNPRLEAPVFNARC